MPPHTLAGIIAGLATALLFVLSAQGAALALVLSPFLTLPGFVAALGWGNRAAWIATGLAVLAIGGLFGANGAIAYAVAYALPVLWLGHLALLARPAGPVTGTEQPPLEWYPVGRLLAWGALIGTAYAAFAVLIIGGQFQSFEVAVEAYFENDILPRLDDAMRNSLTPELRQQLTAQIAAWLPGMLAAVWLALTLLNLYVAGRLLNGARQLRRPWPDLAATEPPQILPMTLAASLAGAFLLDGTPRLIAVSALAAHLFAYLLIGLAVLHRLTRSLPSRPFILLGTYLSLLIIGPIPALALVILGLLDAIFHLRSRFGGASPAPPGGGT